MDRIQLLPYIFMFDYSISCTNSYVAPFEYHQILTKERRFIPVTKITQHGKYSSVMLLILLHSNTTNIKSEVKT